MCRESVRPVTAAPLRLIRRRRLPREGMCDVTGKWLACVHAGACEEAGKKKKSKVRNCPAPLYCPSSRLCSSSRAASWRKALRQLITGLSHLVDFPSGGRA